MESYLNAHEAQAKDLLLDTITETLLCGLEDDPLEREKLTTHLPTLHQIIDRCIFSIRYQPSTEEIIFKKPPSTPAHIQAPLNDLLAVSPGNGSGWRIIPMPLTYIYGDLCSKFGKMDLEELFKDFQNCSSLIKLLQYPDDVLDEVFGADSSVYEQAENQARMEVLEGKLTPQYPDEWPVHLRALQIAENQKLIAPACQTTHKHKNKILAALLNETGTTKTQIFDLIRPDDPYHTDKSRTVRHMVSAGKQLLQSDPALRLQFQPEVNNLLQKIKPLHL